MTSVTDGRVAREVVEEGSDGEVEYVSPFRDAAAVQLAQRRRLARYPTTSATSGYTTVDPSDMGFKTLSGKEQRAKDIAFPVYLSNNEKRQATVLEKLKAKEAHLQYLQDSQVITDLRRKKGDEKVAEGEVAEGEVAEGEVAEGEAAEGKVLDSEVPEADVVEGKVLDSEVPEADVVEGKVLDSEVPEADVVEGKVLDSEVPEADVTKGKVPEAKVPEAKVPEAKVPDSEVPEAEDVGEEVPETDKTEKQDLLVEPLDPNLAPRVVIPEDANKSFKISFFKSSQPKVEYPIATPENPEQVVITAEDGYLNKAIYDQIQYNTHAHRDWIKNYGEIEERKYYERKSEYSTKLKTVQAEIDEIHAQMEELRKETDKTLEICESEVTRKLLERTQVHVNKKHKVFKETDFLREKKLQEKDSVNVKSTEVQKEIDELNESKSEVQAEYISWSNRLADLSVHIDAKVAKLFDITKRSKKTQSEIDQLNENKKELLAQAEKDKLKHEENTKVLEGINNKDYLPKINQIDCEITELLNKMALIKQESANERIELTAITKKVEEERRAHEEKLKLEAEERKRKEKDLLNKQRIELENIAEQKRLEHEAELAKLQEDLEQMETKLKEQELKGKQLEELQEQEKLKAAEKEKELEELRNHAKAADDSIKVSTMAVPGAVGAAAATVEPVEKVITKSVKTVGEPLKEGAVSSEFDGVSESTKRVDFSPIKEVVEETEVVSDKELPIESAKLDNVVAPIKEVTPEGIKRENVDLSKGFSEGDKAVDSIVDNVDAIKKEVEIPTINGDNKEEVPVATLDPKSTNKEGN